MEREKDMENREIARTVEDMKRLIVNHPVKAYMSIGVDLMGAINDNSEIMVMCISGMWKGAVIILKSLWLLCRCILAAFRHVFFLAFYPFLKLYYVMGARRQIIRHNPEYIEPRQKGQKRKR